MHPSYRTNQFWYDKIDPAKVTVPQWVPLEELHPCDFQSTNLKGCAPSDDEATAFYNETRRRDVRRAYYAMVAESRPRRLVVCRTSCGEWFKVSQVR